MVSNSPGQLVTDATTTAELDLDALAPWVRELVQWLDPEWRPTLAGLISCAPSGLLDDARIQLGRGPVIPVPWTLNTIVRHALVPLAELSLVDGQPMIPELGAILVAVLADPRLGPRQRNEVELVLRESKALERELAAESLGRD
jgi:hypothetical protein